MKKFLIVSTISLFITACTSNNKYSITGTAENENFVVLNNSTGEVMYTHYNYNTGGNTGVLVKLNMNTGVRTEIQISKFVKTSTK
jgi:hypothetical protein